MTSDSEGRAVGFFCCPCFHGVPQSVFPHPACHRFATPWMYSYFWLPYSGFWPGCASLQPYMTFDFPAQSLTHSYGYTLLQPVIGNSFRYILSRWKPWSSFPSPVFSRSGSFAASTEVLPSSPGTAESCCDLKLGVGNDARISKCPHKSIPFAWVHPYLPKGRFRRQRVCRRRMEGGTQCPALGGKLSPAKKHDARCNKLPYILGHSISRKKEGDPGYEHLFSGGLTLILWW